MSSPERDVWASEHAGSENLAVAAAARDGDLIIDLRGELDEVSAPRLWSCLEIELDQGPPRVVLDLSGVSYLSSAGVTVIVRLHRQLSANGAVLVVRSPSDTARRVLDLTGLAARLTFEP